VSNSRYFDIEIDNQRGVITATLRGLWTIDVADRYASALRDAAQSMAKHSGRARWLVNLSSSPVQPREVAERLAAVVPATQEAMGAVVAIVTGQALLAIQVRRVGSHSIRIFCDEKAAYLWLMEQ
jgi:hypothetical protein